jgi:hypothetical protein
MPATRESKRPAQIVDVFEDDPVSGDCALESGGVFTGIACRFGRLR